MWPTAAASAARRLARGLASAGTTTRRHSIVALPPRRPGPGSCTAVSAGAAPPSRGQRRSRSSAAAAAACRTISRRPLGFFGGPLGRPTPVPGCGGPAAAGTRTQTRQHGHSHSHSGEHGSVTITFKSRKDGSSKTVEAFIGDNLLRCAQSHGVELEGACECSVACSTCHVILDDDLFDELPEPSEEEDDMLDMAFGLTPTSRLGCQVIITEDMDGTEVELPAATRNMYVDGHVPQPH